MALGKIDVLPPVVLHKKNSACNGVSGYLFLMTCGCVHRKLSSEDVEGAFTLIQLLLGVQKHKNKVPLRCMNGNYLLTTCESVYRKLFSEDLCGDLKLTLLLLGVQQKQKEVVHSFEEQHTQIQIKPRFRDDATLRDHLDFQIAAEDLQSCSSGQNRTDKRRCNRWRKRGQA
jgi:hypothetical protein